MSISTAQQKAVQMHTGDNGLKQEQQHIKTYPFWLGGVAASIAVCFTHPLDLAKVRLQNSPTKMSTAHILHRTFLNEGVRGLYIGISASILRQMTYSLTRFAAYDELKRYVARHSDSSKPLSVWTKIGVASLAGAAGGMAGNPADVILVRMISDMFRPPQQQFNYRGAIDGLVRSVREEGTHVLFRGITPNVLRAMLMNTSQLASYDFFKDLTQNSGLFKPGSLAQYLTSSLLAGTVATTITSPVDVVRARLMNERGSNSGVPQLLKALRTEGPMFMFRGWVPSWIRLAPNTVILLTVLEKLRDAVDWARGT